MIIGGGAKFPDRTSHDTGELRVHGDEAKFLNRGRWKRNEEEEGGRRKEEGGKRKEERGRRKEEGGRRSKEEEEEESEEGPKSTAEETV